jgi:hypothetical protein
MENPAPIFRFYRPNWAWRTFAILFLGFASAFVIAMFEGLVSGRSEPKPTELAISVVLFIAGVGMAIHVFTTVVGFTQDTIYTRNLLGIISLPLNGIRGRREYVVRGDEGGGTPYLRLEPDDDRLPTLDFAKNYSFDDAFFRWFYVLRDLDAEDKHVHKDSNFGLV